jgi:hypothetical protein
VKRFWEQTLLHLRNNDYRVIYRDFGSDTTEFDLRDHEALLLAVIVQFNFAPIREPKFQVPLFVARLVDVNRDL